MKIFSNKISYQGERNPENWHNPWAGLASYDDPETAVQKLKFCGRDDDSYDVAKLIQNNIFITLYGKSGIGKTSLLNAGVFPELREKQFSPLSLRLGMRDLENPKSFQTMIVEFIEHTVNRIDTIDVVDKQLDEHAADYLWNYFVRHRFYDKYGEATTPVVVFDQFEEVFRSEHVETDTLLRQLDYINDKDHSLDNCTIIGQPYRYETNFRFVISIREDDLYRLEDSIDNCYLPALKRCRYRLRSLSEEGARDAILIPGEGLFLPEEQDGIVKAIIDKSRNEDGSISTNIVSLLCNRIFVEHLKKNAEYISSSLVDSFIKGNPFERFYNEATRGFSNREKSYIEDHLVDSTGRRNSVPESDFLLHIKRGSTLLMGNTRILQRTSTSDSGNYRIELIHDSFCAPLAEMKEKRAKRKRLLGIALMTAFSLMSIAIIVYILNINHRIRNFASQMVSVNQQLRNDSLLKVAHLKQIETQKANAEKQKDLADAAQARAEMGDKMAKEEKARAEAAFEREKVTRAEKDSLQRAFDKLKTNSLQTSSSKSTSNNKVEKIGSGYRVDGILYQYEQPTKDQITSWANLHHQECAKKIKMQMKPYDVPSDMVADAPCLVYMILNSKSINTKKEKQSWFDLWPLMNDEQIYRLYEILYQENFKLASKEYKDQQRQQEIKNKYSGEEDDPEELNNLAYVYAREGKEKWDEAISIIDKAIKLNPKEANYYDSKGEILLMMGDQQNALKMWRKVMELDSEFLQKHSGSNLYKQLKNRGLIK